MYSLPKGTFDILPGQSEPWRCIEKWHFVESRFREVARLYNFREIRTPIFEKTELFVRAAGEASDIVSKEMYTFEDKGERSMTLRPEGTAPVVRAYLEKGLHAPLCQKLFYTGPYFRYDRPQAGRFRQFHQFGVEYFGSMDAFADFETISMAFHFYRELGLKDLKLSLNSIGTESTRIPYKNALREYLRPHFSALSEDSKVRLEKNPLRILDSKDPADRALLKDAPTIDEFLDPISAAHFDELRMHLTNNDIPFEYDPHLVRGLDYYNKTVFEISSGVLGAQNVLGGGGRYDGFVKEFGGPDIPGIGFGTGIERILITMDGQGASFPEDTGPTLYIIPIGEPAEKLAQELVSKSRGAKISADIHSGSKKIGKALQTAEQMGSRFALVLGENEISTSKAVLRNVSTREELSCTLSTIIQTVQSL